MHFAILVIKIEINKTEQLFELLLKLNSITDDIFRQYHTRDNNIRYQGQTVN